MSIAMQNAMTVREESEEKLEMLARSRGLSVVPILGDGNCLFNAVLESAGERGMSAAELRDQAVNAAWHQALSAGVDGPFTVVDGHGEKSVSHELLAQWADDMRRDAVHVDEIAIRGVAGALGKTICVLAPDIPNPIRLFPPHAPDAAEIWVGLLPQINAEDGETLLWGHYMALLPLSEAEMSDAPRGDGPSSVSPPVSDSWDSRENRSEDPSPEETVWVPAFESGGFAVARGALQTGYVHLLHKVVSYDEANEARLEPCVGSADDLIPLEAFFLPRTDLATGYIDIPHVVRVKNKDAVTFQVWTEPLDRIVDEPPVKDLDLLSVDVVEEEKLPPSEDSEKWWIMDFDDIPIQRSHRRA